MCGSNSKGTELEMVKQNLKILVVTQYFWPENMRINDLVGGFVERGHQVTVLTGVPNYPDGHLFEDYKQAPDQFQQYKGADVIRVPMIVRGNRNITLFLNYLSFFLMASILGLFKLRGRQFDVVFVYAVSPIMSAIPAVIIGRVKRAPVFNWVLDLWPETLHAVGVVKNANILKMVGWMVSWIYNRCDYILIQSKSFQSNIAQYCTKPIKTERVVYFPSWAEDDFSNTNVQSSDLLSEDRSIFTVVFAGNLGDSQNFPEILDAAEAVQSVASIRWVIVGDGRASNWVKQQVEIRQLSNVLLLGRHPIDKMPALFAAADALLVSLKTDEIFAKTIPGKVQAYLASGRPILAMIDGEAASVIREAGAGLVSNDSKGLAEIVIQMSQLSQTELAEMGQRGREFYMANFFKASLFKQLEKEFQTATLRKEDTFD
jgi:glycosyltransferase involved in cell wall biosynthesis